MVEMEMETRDEESVMILRYGRELFGGNAHHIFYIVEVVGCDKSFRN
jgi:hypothetical protein